MTVQEIANGLVQTCRAGKFEEAYTNYFAKNAKSIEPMGENPVTEGLDNMFAKGAGWAATTEMHGCEVADPIIAGNYFTTKFILDSTNKETKQRTKMEELALYHVKDGKIVSEQFFYDM